MLGSKNGMRAGPLILLTVALFSASIAGADDSVAINKLISEIDAAARENKTRMLSIITINTDVATTTLEKERVRTGFTLGEVYVAHSIALAAHKSFAQIVKQQVELLRLIEAFRHQLDQGIDAEQTRGIALRCDTAGPDRLRRGDRNFFRTFWQYPVANAASSPTIPARLWQKAVTRWT